MIDFVGVFLVPGGVNTIVGVCTGECDGNRPMAWRPKAAQGIILA